MAGEFVKALVKAQRSAKTTKGGSGLNALSGVGSTRAAVREAEAVGVAAKDAEKAAEHTVDYQKRARLLDDAEKELKRIASKAGDTAVGVVKAASGAPNASGAARLFSSVSSRDVEFLFDSTVDLLRRGKQVDHNRMVGAVREVAVKYLPDVRKEVIDTVATMRGKNRGGARLSTLDTAMRGPVHLPTVKKAKDGGRFIVLGTDRLIGSARGFPQKVLIDWADGTRSEIRVMGELDVTLAMEIKGKTNARGGVAQLEALATRSDPGFVQIDGKFWLLKYDPTKVKHVVIAPGGEELNAAKRALKSGKSVSNSVVVEIPKDFDGWCHGLADHFLDLARKYVASTP
jgi:hypothetical protein